MKLHNPTANVFIGFSIAVGGLSALIIMILILANQAVDNNRWLTHTYVVLRKLDGIVAAISQTESYQRAYLLTEDSRYFVTRDDAMSHAHTLLIDVIELTEDNPSQVARIPKLRQAILEKFDSINHQQAIRPIPVTDITLDDIGRDVESTTKILSIVDAMRQEESDLLLVRKLAVQTDAKRMPVIFSMAFAVVLCVLSYLFFQIKRAIKDQRVAEREAQEARVAAEAATRSKSAFLANMSHEVRTPLNAILGLTRIVLEGDLSSNQRLLLGKIDRSSRALLTVLNDILDFSKIEAGRLSIEREVIDLEAILGDMIELFGPSAELKRLSFHIQIRPAVPKLLMGDAVRIGQILNNLVANAIKFTDKGEVLVAVDSHRDEFDRAWLDLSVADTGIGLSATAKSNLFEPFVQADQSTSRNYGGTGLGLAIVHELAKLMGGSLTMKSLDGGGSRFQVSLPLVAVNPRPIRKPLPVSVSIFSPDPTLSKILVETLAPWGMTAKSLSDLVHDLDEFSDPWWTDDDRRLIIIDSRHPELDAEGLVAKLAKTLDGAQSVARPVLVLTAMAARRGDRLQAWPQFSARTVAWPITPSALLDAISSALDGDAEESAQGGVPQISVLAPSLPTARILLVEDHVINQEVAAHLLNKTACHLTIVASGTDAIQAVEQTSFDAILMDLHMPDMDGIEATRRIRQMPHGINVPILAVTASAMNDEKEACLAAGMNDHIGKPLVPEILFAALKRWMATKIANGPLTPVSFTKPLDNGTDEFAELGRRLHADEATATQLIQRFVDEFIGVDIQIRLALDRGDQIRARTIVHTLSGAAANLALRAVVEACVEMERTLSEGDNLLIAESLETVSRALRELAANDRILAVSLARNDFDKDAQELLAGLIAALETDDVEAQDYFAEARDRFENIYRNEIRPIAEALAGARMRDALELARQLHSQLGGRI